MGTDTVGGSPLSALDTGFQCFEEPAIYDGDQRGGVSEGHRPTSRKLTEEEVEQNKRQQEEMGRSIATEKAEQEKAKKAKAGKKVDSGIAAKRRKKDKNNAEIVRCGEEEDEIGNGTQIKTTGNTNKGMEMGEEEVGGGEQVHDSVSRIGVKVKGSIKRTKAKGPAPISEMALKAAKGNKAGIKERTDEFGCEHLGIMDMFLVGKIIPKNMNHYLEEGKFLHNNLCKGCKTAAESLDKKQRDAVDGVYCYVCDKGLKGEVECSVFFCYKCTMARVEERQGSIIGKGRRSGRNTQS